MQMNRLSWRAGKRKWRDLINEADKYLCCQKEDPSQFGISITEQSINVWDTNNYGIIMYDFFL